MRVVCALVVSLASPFALAASVAGKVTYDGPPPQPTVLVTHDVRVCGRSLPNESVIAHDGALKNVVVWIEGAKGTVAPGEALLDQKGCLYVPHVMAVPVGTTLAINNGDNVLHNVHVYNKEESVLNYALPIVNRPRKAKLEKAGILNAKCDAGHAWMEAYIHVFDHPFFAVTGENGKFEIKELPPGHYSLVVWHEALGEQRFEVDVKDGTRTQDVTFKK